MIESFRDTGTLDCGIAAILRQSGRGRLLVVRGPDRGDWVPIGGAPLTVGSGADCDVVLSDRTISRRHLQASMEDRGVVVRDLGSRNGSYVQGARFTEVVLGFGAEICIGETVLKYLPEEEALEPPPTTAESFGHVIGRDTKIRRVFKVLEDVAPSDATVLLEGETGTGKEILAEEIHRHSPRRGKPFVVFDCGAVSRELIESSLFGHVRGAFSGALEDRRGAFAEAEGGTLFLDEIGELAPEIQPALLRAIDKRVIRPIGADAHQKIDVRIVAATNRSLRTEVAARRFREDLFYRLAVVKIAVPPLRERPDDLVLLIEHFLREFAGPGHPRVRPGDLEKLAAYPWPGNVRELRNAIERACLVAHGDFIDFAALLEPEGGGDDSAEAPRPAARRLPYKAAKAQLLEGFERSYFGSLFQRHGGNLSAAAREAQVDRKLLRDLLRKLGLRGSS